MSLSPTLNLRNFDWIILNTSSGKDSQTTARVVAELAEKQNVSDRLIGAHADLGEIEWPGCKELAQKQTEMYGIKHFWSLARPQGDFLDLVRDRGKWPDSQNRLCTSSLKRDQIAKLFTELTVKLDLPKGKRARILNCMGMRAQESPMRAGMTPLRKDMRSTNGKRLVVTWLPIHAWKLGDVWGSIRASGVPYHYAYDLGMKRLSCCFCVFADKASLMLAGKHSPELLDKYVKLEAEIGHDFRHGFKIESIQQALKENADLGTPADFVM